MDVYGRRGGRVESLWVADGEQVEAGQRLLQLRRGTRLPEAGELGDLLAAELEREQRNLERERATLRRREAVEREAIAADLRDIDARAERIDVELRDQRQLLIVARQRRQAIATLERRGHASVDEVRVAFAGVLEAHRGWLALRGQRQAAMAERQRLLHRRAAARLASQQAMIELDGRAAALDKARLELTAGNVEVLRAPASGRVRIIQARPGQDVQPERPLLTIYPESAPLEAVLMVPSRAVGFVRPGQPVRLRYDAFPHQRFGVGEGRVQRIDLAAPAPLSPAGAGTTPVYRALVVLERPAMSAYGQDWPLLPGMTLTADIELDRRSLMAWLLDPLLAMRSRS